MPQRGRRGSLPLRRRAQRGRPRPAAGRRHRARRYIADRESAGRRDDRGSRARGPQGYSTCSGLTPRKAAPRSPAAAPARASVEKSPIPWSPVAPQRIELRGDAKAPPQRRLRQMRFGGAIVSAQSTPSTISRWRPIGSVGQRDHALVDRRGRRRARELSASPGSAPKSIVRPSSIQHGRGDRPLRLLGRAAQRHEARPVEAADVRRWAGGARSSPRPAGRGFRAPAPCVAAGRPRRGEQRHLGLGRDDRRACPSTSHHSPAMPAASRERVDVARGRARAARVGRVDLGEDQRRARGDAARGRRAASSCRRPHRRWCRAGRARLLPARASRQAQHEASARRD